MAKKRKTNGATKRRVGRPSKGPTVYVGMRLPKELHAKVKELWRETEELKTLTAAFEKLIFDGLDAQDRWSTRELIARRKGAEKP